MPARGTWHTSFCSKTLVRWQEGLLARPAIGGIDMNAKKLAGALAVAAGSAVTAACTARARPRTRWPRSCVPASTISAWSSTST